MAEPILMPRLTIDMEKGTVLEWHKEEGETVEKGEIVAVVFGDKVEWEVEAPSSGTLIKILVGPEEEADVARPIAYVGEPGEAVPADEEAAPAPAPPSAAPAPAPSGTGSKEGEGALPEARKGKPKASPAAKRIAREKGIDLSRVKGTGPGGRIVEADVRSTAGEPALEKGPPKGAISLSPLRKIIADRMLRSWRIVPHFTVETQVNMEAAASFRKTGKGPDGKSFTFNDLIIASVGKALSEAEEMRRRWDGETLIALEGTNLGVAVHTDMGLVVPVVEDVAGKGLTALALHIRQKAERARSGKLRPEDLRPAAMTVTNLGMFGITRFVPVVNHPECSILAVGEVEDRPVAWEGGMAVKPMMAVNLAVDHRAIDGGMAARFLARVKDILEAGEWGMG